MRFEFGNVYVSMLVWVGISVYYWMWFCIHTSIFVSVGKIIGLILLQRYVLQLLSRRDINE